jgi:hypothetical protein
MDITCLFVVIANRDIEITCIPTQHQLADTFTKALPPSRFFAFCDLIGVHQPP